MSCTNATAPINITKNTVNICNLNCSYTFTYPPTNLMITNKGSYLQWKVENTSTPPVNYNSNKYDVTEVRIYCPSLHTFANKSAAAEMIISHTNSTANKTLLVCIPLVTSTTSSSDSVNFFDMVMSSVATDANAVDGTTTLNKPSFNLGKFVPMKPYFSYTGTMPYDNCDNDADYIVFHQDDATAISPSAFNILKRVITAHTITTTTSNTYGLFYNANGPVPPNKGEVYIDCRPTGDDGEVLVPLSLLDPKSILDNVTIKAITDMTLVKLIVGAIMMFIIWKIAIYIIRKISEKSDHFSVKTDVTLVKNQ